jgi:hypothetical protein
VERSFDSSIRLSTPATGVAGCDVGRSPALHTITATNAEDGLRQEDSYEASLDKL